MDIQDRKSKGNLFIPYLRMFAKHKFLAIIPLVVVFLGSAIFGSTLPKGYKATAVFRMLQPYALRGRSDRRSAEDDLDVMKQLILSRSNLVEVIRDVGFDASYAHLPEARREAREAEVVKQLRKNLEVQQKANKVFEISYRSEDPETAARVTNAAMQRYHEGVLKTEREQMEATVAFLERKVKEYETNLAASSEALAQFIAANMQAWSGSELSDLAQLKTILDDLRDTELKLSDAETAKKELEKKIAVVPPTVEVTLVKDNPRLLDLREKRESAALKLANLKTLFTDLHPKVIEVSKEIETLDSLINATEKTTIEVKHEPNPLFLKLRDKLDDADVGMVSAKGERTRLLARKKEYEKRAQNVPGLQKQMKKFEREDELNQEQLKYYTGQLREAKIELERGKEQGTRFRILDYARKSSASATSNRLKISLLGLIVGSGLGLGLAVLKDQMDTSFKDVEDAASFLDVPIIGTIPVINTASERAREKKKEVLGWMIVGALVILLGAALIVTSLTSFPGR